MPRLLNEILVRVDAGAIKLPQSTPDRPSAQVAVRL
jgi:hypothetical protein